MRAGNFSFLFFLLHLKSMLVFKDTLGEYEDMQAVHMFQLAGR